MVEKELEEVFSLNPTPDISLQVLNREEAWFNWYEGWLKDNFTPDGRPITTLAHGYVDMLRVQKRSFNDTLFPRHLDVRAVTTEEILDKTQKATDN